MTKLPLPDFSQFCEQACVALWGQPQLRTPKQLRWSGDNAYGSRTYDVQKRVWFDRGADRGGSTLELMAFSKGLPNEKLKGRAFFDMWRALYDLGVGVDPPPANKAGGNFPPILATYPYTDADGALLFEVVRLDVADPDARFKQRRPDGKGGWIWDIKGVPKPLPLYRLPQLNAAAGERVLITEGEKDANTAVALGYAATTMCGGVGKWRREYDAFFAGADVVVVSDNDAHGKGQEHAAKVAKRLSKVAAQVRTIMFKMKDFSEWVAAGHTRAEMDALIELAPVISAGKAADDGDDADKDDEVDDKAAEAAIEGLAKLSAIEYERQRKAVAEKLNLRATILDRLVEAARLRLDPDGGKQGQGESIEFPQPEPWSESVEGAALLDAVAGVIRKHVVLSDRDRDICALWTVHAYLFECFLITPRLAIRSPTRGCGKTTLLDVIEHLVPKPLRTSSVTAAVTFRVIAAHQPTLLIDEAKNIGDKPDLLEVLNDGHRRGGRTLRNVALPDGYEPRSFATFAPLAIALIGSLPAELHDRSVMVDMNRRQPGDKVDEVRVGRSEHLDIIARKIMRWAIDTAVRIGDLDPVMPPGVYNREADNWKPLLAIADSAGGDWPQRARDAAIKSHAAADIADASMIELLLADIRTAFGAVINAERTDDAKSETPVTDMLAAMVEDAGPKIISSADLVDALVEMEGRPWPEMGKSRKPLTTSGLARLLRPLKIGPDNVGPKGTRDRGYKLAQFKDAFERYLPPEGDSKCSPVHHAANTGTSDDSRVFTSDQGEHFETRKKYPDSLGGEQVNTLKGGSNGKMRVETILKSSDGMPPYIGPVTPVPQFSEPDPLDEHGMPAAPPSSFTPGRLRELAREYYDRAGAEFEDTCEVEQEHLNDWLRGVLRKEAAFQDEVEPAFEEIMKLVFAM